MVYKLRQKLFSWFRENYEIKDKDDEVKFFVKPELAITVHFSLLNTNKDLLLKISKRYFRYFARFDIKNSNDELIAYTKRKPTFFVRRTTVYDKNKKPLYYIKGDVFGWNFDIINTERKKVAEINKKIIALTDNYGVEILDEANTEVLLAIAMVIDTVYHKERRITFSRR